MAASSSFDVSELSAHMEVGKPLTFEEMQRERSNDQSLQSLSTTSTERNPYVFEDKPVNHNNFAVLSMLANSMNQRHETEPSLIKIRGAFPTLEDVRAAQLPTEKCDLFACELYKFCILPCSDEILALGNDKRDELMNKCLMAYESVRVTSVDDFDERKRMMTDDIKRQEEIKKKVRKGELPESAIESESICPEPLQDQVPERTGPLMLSDRPLDDFTHAVLAIINIQDITDADKDNTYDIPDFMKDKTITKIAGVFRTEDDAHKHAEKLRKIRNYKHIDLFVVAMYEWLHCPPNVELLPNVKYAQDKLTEAIGTLKDEVSPSDVLQSMLESDIEGQIV